VPVKELISSGKKKEQILIRATHYRKNNGARVHYKLLPTILVNTIPTHALPIKTLIVLKKQSPAYVSAS
jgi:hypothetical protein